MTQKVFSLAGKVALVTGASSGLGKHFAGVLAEAGAQVVVGARRLERLNNVVASIESAGGRALAARLDVTDPEPILDDDPLLSLPNCLVVPHIASGTVSSRNGMAEIAANNLLAGLSGQPLPCWVNPEVDGGQESTPR